MIRLLLVIFVLAVLSFGCRSNETTQKVQSDPAVTAFVEAADRFKQLQQEGKIPGFNAGEHGVVRSPRIECVGQNGLQYPLNVSMQVEKTGERDTIYWLVFQKLSPTSAWELIRAWQTDSLGQNRKELVTQAP